MVGDIETEIYYSEHVTAIVMPYGKRTRNALDTDTPPK
jgi:hypothetical protein